MRQLPEGQRWLRIRLTMTYGRNYTSANWTQGNTHRLERRCRQRPAMDHRLYLHRRYTDSNSNTTPTPKPTPSTYPYITTFVISSACWQYLRYSKFNGNLYYPAAGGNLFSGSTTHQPLLLLRQP